MIKILFLINSLAISTFAIANEQEQSEQYKRIYLWLSGYEWSLDESNTSELGENSEKILIQIAQESIIIELLSFQSIESINTFSK